MEEVEEVLGLEKRLKQFSLATQGTKSINLPHTYVHTHAYTHTHTDTHTHARTHTHDVPHTFSVSIVQFKVLGEDLLIS